MRNRLIAFILYLPLLLSGMSGDIVLPVSGESNAHQHLSFDIFSDEGDGWVGSLPIHDGSNHIHETMDRLVLIPFDIPDRAASTHFIYPEDSPVRRHYPLLRPPLFSMA